MGRSGLDWSGCGQEKSAGFRDQGNTSGSQIFQKSRSHLKILGV